MSRPEPNVLFAYKSFVGRKGISHVGLGVSCHLTSKVLCHNGVRARAEGVNSAADIEQLLAAEHFTHIVVAAPWMPTNDMAKLCRKHHKTHFSLVCHSNVGFLQTDPQGIQLFREALELEQGQINFHVAGNCQTFAEATMQAYRKPCLTLPNLYFLDDCLGDPSRPGWAQTGGTLRIGIFGATRPQKNILTAVWSALGMHSLLKVDTEVWVSTERADDPSTNTIFRSCAVVAANVPGFSLKPLPWAPWTVFRKQVAHTHILLCPSYSESYCIVVADGIAEGIPAVVSSAIDWAPPQWIADTDDANDITERGIAILHNPHAPRMGMTALRKHNAKGIAQWIHYLTSTRP